MNHTGGISMQSLSLTNERPNMMALANDVARRVFGFQGLRFDQVEVLKEVFLGRDALAVLPTGSGKSLIYALPALMSPGLTVVVSPLIALIRDQVVKFRKLGIGAAAFDSHQNQEQKIQVVNALRQGKVKLLFVSPERIALERFREFLCSLDIRLIALDEAHCISQWGFNFRPEYRKLGEYLDALPRNIPRLALTATATRKVREDILDSLRLRNPAVLVRNPVRENLETGVYRVAKVEEALQLLVHKTWECTGQGIIYAGTRQRVEEVSKRLVSEGMTARSYHAGLSTYERASTQHEFSSGHTRIVVATNAFGLGIDKSDIRFVHHFGLTQCLEQYLQEIGRAGRDGGFAKCNLIYTTKDYHIQKFLIEKSFPQSASLKRVYEVVQDFGLLEYSSFEFMKKLTSITNLSKEDGNTCLDVLTREGWILQVPTIHGDYRLRLAEVEGFEAFLEIYSQRRLSAISRLETMFHYVSSGSHRSQFINHYFFD
jgi:ATP-dependent DNA helicase RecQ